MKLRFAAFLLSSLLLLPACTVTPPVSRAVVASWDGGQQNSGFICWQRDASGAVTGAAITPHGKARYDALMAAYGARFKPAVQPGDGCQRMEDGSWSIDAQHLSYFGEALWWDRQKVN